MLACNHVACTVLEYRHCTAFGYFEAYQHERAEAVDILRTLIAQGLLTAEVSHILVIVCGGHRAWPVLWLSTSRN